MKPSGKQLIAEFIHCCGDRLNDRNALEEVLKWRSSETDDRTKRLLSEILKRYFIYINYGGIFIPSFCENWVFASAKAK